MNDILRKTVTFRVSVYFDPGFFTLVVEYSSNQQLYFLVRRIMFQKLLNLWYTVYLILLFAVLQNMCTCRFTVLCTYDIHMLILSEHCAQQLYNIIINSILYSSINSIL